MTNTMKMISAADLTAFVESMYEDDHYTYFEWALFMRAIKQPVRTDALDIEIIEYMTEQYANAH